MADTYVEQVQIWLNEEYGAGGVPAWGDPLPVTGKPGWSTMYKLTRALQWELGITALSNNFGAGTLTALTNHGPIKSGEANSNIVRILQGGLYCQGYNPGGFDGIWGNGVATAVAAIMTDMGLTPPSPVSVSPKVFKGILTMNAYTLLPGGRSDVRAVQRWLNNKYLARANFFISPADGLPSRDTQTNLIYALQYELGMTDSVANGNFGPGTKTGLQQQALFGVGATDSTKNFVRLFHAGLIFNEVAVPFDDTLSAADSAKVKEFQAFCILDQTGTADYRTWCSLLVSTGDPERPGTACDTATPLNAATAATIYNAGYRVVGRYLTNTPGGTLNKRIQDAELSYIFGAGLAVFPIFQESGNSAAAFDFQKGRDAARKAYDAAYRLRLPQGTTIYFAVDFDPTGEDITERILPHFMGISAAMNARGDYYKTGVYGTRNVCREVAAAGYAEKSFVAGMSTGYSGNLGYPLPTNWAFDQIKEYTVGSGAAAIGIDKDVRSGRDAGVSGVAPAARNEAVFRALDVVWMHAVEWHADHPSSKAAFDLALDLYRLAGGYAGTDWDVVAGPIDSEFVNATVATLSAAGFDIYADNFRMAEHPDMPNGEAIALPHIIAAAATLLKRGLPTTPYQPSDAEIGGWAGDLLSVLNGYQGALNAWHEGEAADPGTLENYATATLLKVGVSSRFGLADYLEDCIGDWLARSHSADASATLPSLIRSAFSFGTPRETFYTRFRNARVGNSSADTEALGINTLTGPVDGPFGVLRAMLLAASSPGVALGQFSQDARTGVGVLFGQRVNALAAGTPPGQL